MISFVYSTSGEHGFLFPEFELVTEPEEETDEDESDYEKYSKYLQSDKNEETHSKYLQSDKNEETQNLKIEELQKMAVKETKEDKTFLAFKKRVAKDPEQVIKVAEIFFLEHLNFHLCNLLS